MATHEALEALLAEWDEDIPRARYPSSYEERCDHIRENLRAILAKAEEPHGDGLREAFGKWIRENIGAGEDGNQDYIDEVEELVAIALASPARTEGQIPKYPVELRCAELEELLRDLGKALKALPATDGRVIGLIAYLDRIDAALAAHPPVSVDRNEIALRFSGAEGDAAAEERKLLAGKVWECAACGKQVRGEELVIHPRGNYFYHEKSSGELCGRYEEVAAHPPQQGETP